MESIFFPSKSSFAVFVWLTLCLVSTLSIGSTDKLYTTLVDAVDHSLTRLLNIQNSILPMVSEIVVTAAKAIEPVSIITSARADEIDLDVSYPPSESMTKIVPKTDLQCMAENIYYEAGSQSYAGKIAVGQVVLNRVKSPSYPRTICGVIYEGSAGSQAGNCQFAWTCSKKLPVSRSSDNWFQSLRAATDLLQNKDRLIDIVEGATSFHASSVRPTWTKKLKFIGQIGEHLFYASK